MISVKEVTTHTIVIKKSEFVCHLIPCSDIEQAKSLIAQYSDLEATHNCVAYIIGSHERANDDGEPSQTAGMPMLNVLKMQNLTNIIAIVTRYFGGILLGTGGLVKAYSQATKMAIENAKFAVEENGILAEINLNYNDFDNFKYCCRKSNVKILDIEYLNNIRCKIEATNGEKEELIRYVNKNEIKIMNFTILQNKKIRKNIEI